MSDDDDGVKRCARCAAWIPSVATMCAYCGTSSPDRIDSKPLANALGLPRYVSVTNVLITANVVWFAVEILMRIRSGGEGSVLQAAITGTGAGDAIWELGSYDQRVALDGQPWRLFTHMFLHFGLIHLALNMMSLRSLGPMTELLLGGTRLAVVYLVGGVGAGLAAGWWYVRESPGQLHSLAGASGAICAIAGCLVAFLLRRGNQMGRAAAIQIAKSLAFTLVAGFVIPQVSNAAHFAGGLIGAGFGMLVNEAFSLRISSSVNRNWALVAFLLALASAVSLGAGLLYSLREIS